MEENGRQLAHQVELHACLAVVLEGGGKGRGVRHVLSRIGETQKEIAEATTLKPIANCCWLQ